ncbi:hypothetical protein MRX96_043330 [Rhipicephalus microplus]
MSSYTLPEITNPVVQAAISAQRRAPGVHIYLDAAYKDSTNAWIYSNVICDIEKTKTVTYSFLVQIHKDNPDYAIGFIVPDDDKVGARTGFDIKTQTLYGSVKTYYPNTWWTYVPLVNNATLKAGDFVVHTLQYTYPSKNSAYESEMRPRISVYDECYPRLSDISAGGSAVIVGSYIPTDPATDGIMIGYYQTKKNFHVFSEYKVTGVEVIFNITVTNFLFSIATKDKRVLLNDNLVSDGWYSLIVQNINIKNMEIGAFKPPERASPTFIILYGIHSGRLTRQALTQADPLLSQN